MARRGTEGVYCDGEHEITESVSPIVDWLTLRCPAPQWPEGYGQKTQSHIMVTRLPDTLSSLPSNDILAQVQPATPSSVASQTVLAATGASLSADQVADLFFLEVTAFNSRLGDVVLVFDQGFWNRDAELWQSVQKVCLDLKQSLRVTRAELCDTPAGRLERRRARRRVQAEPTTRVQELFRERGDLQGPRGAVEAGHYLSGGESWVASCAE